MKKLTWHGRVIGLLVILLTAVSVNASAAGPRLAFSDLISGPDRGLGDGKGSGVVVTLWGQNLGNEAVSELVFRDSAGTEHNPPIYYWKNADGKLPSGPANLFESHGMQEIAFSVPDSQSGKAEVFIRKAGQASNMLDFTVRDGQVFHVASRGSSSGNGSWNSPFDTVSLALSKAPAGSTIYIHDVDTGDMSSPQARGIYWNKADASSSLEAQMAIISFPGFHPKVIAQKAVENYKVEALVVSKLDIYASNYLKVDKNGQPVGPVIQSSPGDTYGIQTTKDGRVVSNRIGDIVGGCASKWNGAINGNRARVSNVRIYGNEIYDYGCNGTSKLHHTTYLSIRGSGNPIVEPWEWAFNYLHGNKAKFGIHNYDQGEGCGDMSGPLVIRDNVIIDQGGAGISVGSTCGWSMNGHVYNNILKNVGLAAAWDGVDPSSSDGAENGGIALRDQGAGGLKGNYAVFNNTIYGWTNDDQRGGAKGCLALHGSADNVSVDFFDNICVAEKDRPFVGATNVARNKLDNVSGFGNLLYYKPEGAPDFSVIPEAFAGTITQDPGLEWAGSRYWFSDTDALTNIRPGRSATHYGGPGRPSYDIYGNSRGTGISSIGAVSSTSSQFSPPRSPENLTVEKVKR